MANRTISSMEFWQRAENYTRNEWRRCENYTRNEWRSWENCTLNEWRRWETTLEASGEDEKTTLETSGEDRSPCCTPFCLKISLINLVKGLMEGHSNKLAKQKSVIFEASSEWKKILNGTPDFLSSPLVSSVVLESFTSSPLVSSVFLHLLHPFRV